jgi:type VI protein secretion system component VasK
MGTTSPSYVELCIGALPAAKQAAAREAFHDLLEGREDDNMVSRLLLIFESTAAYARTIPEELTAVMQRQLCALDERLAQAATNTLATDEKRLGQMGYILRTQFPLMIEKLAPDRLADAIESLRISVNRLERSSQRQRRVRLSVVLACVVLALAAGVGGTVWWFYRDYTVGQAAQRRFDVLRDYGLNLQLENSSDQMLRVTLSSSRSPMYDQGWLVDDNKKCVGVELLVPPPSQ